MSTKVQKTFAHPLESFKGSTVFVPSVPAARLAGHKRPEVRDGIKRKRCPDPTLPSGNLIKVCLQDGDRLVARFYHMLEPSPVRRIEVIAGSGKRRRWTDDEKARVIEETLQTDAVVSEIARRHWVTPQHMFTWRREARRRAEAEGVSSFVPTVINGRETAPAQQSSPVRRRQSSNSTSLATACGSGATRT